MMMVLILSIPIKSVIIADTVPQCQLDGDSDHCDNDNDQDNDGNNYDTATLGKVM